MISCEIVSFPEKLVLKLFDMESQKDSFLAQWKEKFPGANLPNLNFTSVEDAEKGLNECKSLIKSLEEKLNQERFYLIFLQTYIASKKKSYTRERWGFNREPNSSSLDSEETVTSPLINTEGNLRLTTAVNGEPKEASENLTKQGSFNKPPVKMRSKDGDKGKDSRLSKVLANVKLFEAKGDGQEASLSSIVESSTSPPGPNITSKPSTRARSSYLEVWECKTGADKEQQKALDDEITESKLNSAAIAMASSGKPSVVQRESRKDYEEVWTCKTGDHVSVGIVYDDQQGALRTAPSQDEDLDNAPDYDVEDIDMKDGYGKRHYTIAGSDVKLRSSSLSNDPTNTRGTWPAAGPQYQDGEVDGKLAEQADAYSASIDDLSDLDNDDRLSDSPHSDTEDSVDSAQDQTDPNTYLKPMSETSPLHRLRRAQTTNERMSVAFSAYQECWSDEDRATPDRSSMLSAHSTDLHSSDDDRVSDDEGQSPVSSVPVTSDSSTPIFVYSKPKRPDAETRSNDNTTTDNRKSIISIVEGNIPEIFGSPKDNEAVSDMVDYHKVRSIAEAEKLRMRRWVLTSLMDTEEAYLQYLNTLLLYMKPLKATIGTSQPVMSAQDFDTLFFRVQELHELHSDFYTKLKPRLDKWSADTAVGDLFRKLLSKLNFYGDYLNNYKRAQHTVEKCAKENAQFATIIESLKVQSRRSKDSESISLIEVLYKPVERVMRTTLVLQDLLKHTPHRHPDYQILRQVLKQSQSFLERINSSSSSSYKPRRVPSSAVAAARSADRELIKDGFLVEVAADGSRKLRHCFLYSDLLLCAKQKSAAGVFHNKDTYECKWYIPLADLSFKPKEDSDVMPDASPTSEDELRDMGLRAQQLKHDISRERKRNEKRRKSADSSPVKSRQEERLRKKLAELEARIVLASPDLPLRIYHMQGKSYMFLMCSDYERTEWTDAIMKRQESCFKSFTLTSYEITKLLETCVRHKKVNNIGSMLMKEDEELFSGYLNVTIHSGQGFLRACNPYCTLEVDSYGQFQTKAKTRPCHDTKTPVWNEEFELDLDGAMTLRVLCYDRAREAAAGSSYDDDVLIAKGKVSLNQESLRNGEWIEESVLMNELTIKVSVKFVARERSLQRLPSKISTGVFGVKIETVSKRDSSGIPSIVRKCIAEVERRGMNEVGIYRVSGVASEIQALKASFEIDRKDVNVLLGEVDINAVAGVLKLYFRELPEPLFTNARYSNFIESSSLADPETKQRAITRLLSDLPPANYKTLYYLRNHLVKVANNELANKMSMHNLATVFGPTLLRPAEDKNDPATQTLSQNALMLNALRLDVHYQMDVLLYCLQLDEMQDYETLKSSLNAKEKTDKKPSSRSCDNLSALSQNDQGDSLQNDRSNDSKVTRSATSENVILYPKLPKDVSANSIVPPPAAQQRYHPYEEIEIPAFVIKPKPQLGKPQGAPNPPLKPKPAPRKGPFSKQPSITISDL